MNIPENLIEQWEKLKSAGDAEKIAFLSKPPIGAETVRKAFRDRKCRDGLFLLICNYYKEKAAMVIEESNSPILAEAKKILDNAAAEQVD